ncbi:unnamed protein product (macronuclear) [Paramecium tetraurelia]|uniref:Transmembrane protein n=1 Tax=Paramecium tetraurelia TaxID=5888 RepID=A0ECL4_PARTE|nr:uncharacterized protein GSPATT00003900001 [Paramecium tetraurelia]CAK93031.1 unnamed protein product [Paramecium tetraurelia]|eukprot:XP_001460428.1 hypothetical protein (macronuclear) [Paramecium tetraurelia strain d4-2]
MKKMITYILQHINVQVLILLEDNQFSNNYKLEKIIQNLSPHYKMQISFQLWQIDSWNNENFQLYVDDQLQKQIVLSKTGNYSICGSAGLEKLFNIAVTFPHTSSDSKITMKTNHINHLNQGAFVRSNLLKSFNQLIFYSFQILNVLLFKNVQVPFIQFKLQPHHFILQMQLTHFVLFELHLILQKDAILLMLNKCLLFNFPLIQPLLWF